MSARDFAIGMNDASQPTLLDLYRQDPCAVRQEIERQAGRARGEAIFKSFARIFA